MSIQSKPIQAKRLRKSFGGRMVLREIDLQISAGECVALTGDNGAGKTTLLGCLAAITRPTSGKVCWFGRPAAASPQQRQLVGLVTHESRLYAHLTLRENLLFAARMCAVAEPRRQVDKLLEQIGLRAQAERQIRQISMGMRQRMALARGLIHDPPILLLDEPFAGLDSKSRDWLAGFLQQKRASGCALFIATHDLAHTLQLADRTLNLRDGWIVGQRVEADESWQNKSWRNVA